MKGQNFASKVLSRHTFRISRKKGSDFFDHRGTLKPKKEKGSLSLNRLFSAYLFIVFYCVDTFFYHLVLQLVVSLVNVFIYFYLLLIYKLLFYS